MTTRTFRVKDFERFQHYKDRAPPWIKLYNKLLDNYEFGQLDDASKWHLVAIWLLASRSANKIPFDPEWVAGRINAREPVDLEILETSGFIVVDEPLSRKRRDASNVLAIRTSDRDLETETETETDHYQVGKVLREEGEAA